MSENKDDGAKRTTLKLGGGSSKLKLGDVKGRSAQGLSQGRVKNVQVEVKKKRRFVVNEQKKAVDEKKNVDVDQVAENADSTFDDGLTRDERDKRLKVLQRASDDKREKESERLLKAKDEVVEEPVSEPANDEVLRDDVVVEEEVVADIPIEDVQAALVKPIKSSERSSVGSKDKGRRTVEKKEERAPKSNRFDEKRRSNKLTISQALSNDGEERMRSLASVRRARAKAKRLAEGADAREKEKFVRDVIVPEVITVQELANRMAERVYDVTKVLMKMGSMVTANQTIDADTAELVVEEFGHKIKRVTDADVEDILKDDSVDDSSEMVARAPVVTFMGHVDHGKTSLLDTIRKSDVTKGEAGGITQHIGAYQVTVEDGKKITFLDTPGHEAFTAMRQRGANATDIVVLVVAADDGIMAQTIEAINHAKAAQVPIIVAINKIDKPDADVQNVRTALLSHELVTEEMGGDVLSVEVSAVKALNIDKLLDAIQLQAEILELKATANRKASGIVVEASVDRNRGVVSTLLVQKGTLKIGDIVIVGEAFGKVRAMKDAMARPLGSAGPSVPVEVLGLDEAPEAGVEFNVVDSERQAREIKEYRQKRTRDLRAVMQQKKGSLEDMFLQAADGGRKELPIVIKGDVQGSIEAIIGSLDKLATEEVGVKVLHAAAGAISTSDLTLSTASRAIVLGFNVRMDAGAKELAVKEDCDIRYYSIIYDLIDDVKAILSGMLAPTIREQFLGNAEIRDVFNISKSGKVAGCFVTDGIIKRGAGVRLLRDNVVIHEGTLKTLKRFKDDVKEVASNFECGMAFTNYDDLKVGDVIEAFELMEEKRTL